MAAASARIARRTVRAPRVVTSRHLTLWPGRGINLTSVEISRYDLVRFGVGAPSEASGARRSGGRPARSSPGEGAMADETLKGIVKEKYGRAALRVTSGGGSCCGAGPSRGECDPITSNLYGTGETA